LIIPQKYNCQFHERTLGITRGPAYIKDEYYEALKDPVIVHLMSKPWGQIYNSYFGAYFFGYASRTPFFEFILQRMRDKDLICRCVGEGAIKDNIKRLFKNKQPHKALRVLLKCASCLMLRGCSFIPFSKFFTFD
jgi:hypothetical protein